MHTTRLRQATPSPLKTIEPGRDERAVRVDTTISRPTRGYAQSASQARGISRKPDG